MRLSKREKVLIQITLIIGTVALFVFYYYFPRQDKIRGLHEESQTLSLELDEYKITKLLVDEAKKEAARYRLEIAESDDYLMDSIDEPNILYYISNVIKDTSKEQYVEYNDLAVGEDYISKDISLKFKTTFEDLLNIMKQFEGAELYTTLSSLDINVNNQNMINGLDGEEEEDNHMPLEVEYTLRFYGTSATWGGEGVYEFMDSGKFSKHNIFE